MTDYTGSNTPAEQRDLWRTPPALFVALDAEFCFQLDAAAAPHNALCRKFITADQDTLITPWGDHMNLYGYAWLNPPYSDITPFVKKAALAAHRMNRDAVSAMRCSDCDEELLEARRKAYPGCTMCVDCQADAERWNRRM